MKFRKKPVVVEAILWEGSHLSTKKVLEFMGQEVGRDFMTQNKFSEFVNMCQSFGLPIDTLEGKMRADVGDWIIKGVAGEFYPCKPDIFKMTYEEVKDIKEMRNIRCDWCGEVYYGVAPNCLRCQQQECSPIESEAADEL